MDGGESAQKQKILASHYEAISNPIVVYTHTQRVLRDCASPTELSRLGSKETQLLLSIFLSGQDELKELCERAEAREQS